MKCRTCKWTVRADEALVNRALTNAFVAHRHLNAGEDTALAHKTFRLTVASELLNNPYDQNERNLRQPLEYRPELNAVPVHEMVAFPPGSGPGNKRKRLNCAACPNLTPDGKNHARRPFYYCRDCDEIGRASCRERGCQ